LGVTDDPAPDDKARKKAEREKRKKARQEAKLNNQKDSGKSSDEISFTLFLLSLGNENVSEIPFFVPDTFSYLLAVLATIASESTAREIKEQLRRSIRTL